MGSRMLADRYELLEKIGDGGMAVVYKAKDKLLNRFVAVKILKPEFSNNARFLESFRRESQSAASLNHPNIVNIYDVGREGNINFIVMELITGKTLSQIINTEGPLEINRVINIAKQVAMALSVAHKNNIIHRDVKPHNILLTETGVAKITDFGIAKAVSNATIVGTTGTIMGSVHYFSPEQARGGYIDAKSDIYSLGIVIYEMLTGTIPYDGENPVAVALMHMNNEMPRPSLLVPNIPPMVEAIVMKATDKYQVNRYNDADEMYQALERASFSMLGVYGDGSEYMKPEERTPQNRNEDKQWQNPNPEPVFIEEKGAGKHTKDSGGLLGMGQKNGKKKKKVKLNKIKILAIVLALLCAIPVSQLVLGLIGNIGQPKDVEVPDVTGETFEDAKDILKEKGFKSELGDYVVSAEFEEGEVVSQTPESGMIVNTKGTKIKLNVCKSSKSEAVPDVTGKLVRDAEYILEKDGFSVGEIHKIDSELPEDTVVKQSPEGDSLARPGKEINLYISKGSANEENASVPNLMGLSLADAKAQLQAAGLTIGTSQQENSTGYPAGQVMWQQYSAGEKLDKGKSVDVKISAGPPAAAGPKSVAIPVDYGRAQSAVFYITVLVTDDNGSNTPISGAERFKDNGSEVLNVTGTGKNGKVQVLFDNEVVLTRSVDFTTGIVK